MNKKFKDALGSTAVACGLFVMLLSTAVVFAISLMCLYVAYVSGLQPATVIFVVLGCIGTFIGGKMYVGWIATIKEFHKQDEC